MPRPAPSSDVLKQRKRRAEEWKSFRRDYLFTQKKLASIVDISRRTIQQIEAGRITPHPSTLRKFIALRKAHEKNGKFEWS